MNPCTPQMPKEYIQGTKYTVVKSATQAYKFSMQLT
jgi:hypothetical protein